MTALPQLEPTPGTALAQFPPRPAAAHDLTQVVRTRRSVRRFRDAPVPPPVVEQILELAGWAPSGYNRQPWRFEVAVGRPRNRAAAALAGCAGGWLEGIRARCPGKAAARMERFFRDAGGAPVIVFVYSHGNAETGSLTGIDPDYPSTCAAVQNLLLAAHARGLGACWVQAFCAVQEEIDRILGVDGGVLVGGIPLGFPDEAPPAPPRRAPRVTWHGLPDAAEE